MTIGLERAVPLALIITEAITNALKYGKPETGNPVVRVTIRREADDLVLEVKDNGPGLDPAPELERGFGRSLIKTLAVQLNATTEYISDSGTLFHMRFPLSP